MTHGQLEVADVVQRYGAAYLERYAHVTSTAQRRVLQSVSQCRTAVYGGHHTQCDSCGYEVIQYNSCRHRNCPKCQGQAQAAWLESQQRDLLDVPYSHVVFTLPSQLSSLALQNPRVLYQLLFQAVSETMWRIKLCGESNYVANQTMWRENHKCPFYLTLVTISHHIVGHDLGL